MGRLVYAAITSLDLYIEDESGGFGWAMPDDEVHAFVNDLERGAATYLYGRRMYETMAGWETMGTDPDDDPVHREFADMWRAADKIVYSTTLDRPTTARTRVVRKFDPDEVRDLKLSSAGDLTIGGPAVAANAFRAGLVDQVHLFLHPVIVGGGKRAPVGRPGGLGAGGRAPLRQRRRVPALRGQARVGVHAAGRCLIPLMNPDRSRSGSAVAWMSGSRRSSSANITVISRRARWAPRQKWGPGPPKPM